MTKHKVEHVPNTKDSNKVLKMYYSKVLNYDSNRIVPRRVNCTEGFDCNALHIQMYKSIETRNYINPFPIGAKH